MGVPSELESLDAKFADDRLSESTEALLPQPPLQLHITTLVTTTTTPTTTELTVPSKLIVAEVLGIAPAVVSEKYNDLKKLNIFVTFTKTKTYYFHQTRQIIIRIQVKRQLMSYISKSLTKFTLNLK